ncbi:ATP-binding protein, partial [Candidatus Nomurabacteria bacterium]|nr:ATP-binding protein [Candidatus Nomurabacteria bacterium]
MFIGREKEKQIILKHIDSSSFEFGIVYGRRRVGKTALLKEVMKQNTGIYFVANEMGFDYNISEFAGTVANYFNESVTFKDLEMIFSYLCKKSLEQRVLVVIDEFSYLFSREPGVQSVLQNIIDNELIKSNVKLILAGSQVGMIEEVISYKKPLYGRTTFRLKITAFDYFDAAKFYPGFSSEDRIRAYGVLGGIPYYLSKVDDSFSLRDNIIDLVLREGSFLADETEFFLKQELRAVSSYGMIIHSVSRGATRLNEISTKSQIGNTGTATKYINILRDLDIIYKEVCFGEGESSKKTIYKLKDHSFDFYYTFVMTKR